MSNPFPVRAALAVALAATFLSACDRPATTQAQRSADSAGQKLDNAIDRTNQKLAAAGDRIQPRLAEAGAAISQAGEKVVATVKDAAVLGDTAITASIKTDFLKDPDLSVLKIDVDTRDGVVTLNGLAENEAARVRAEKMASAVKGVREVRNFLTVKRA